VRWDSLFADLEAQASAAGLAERAAEVDERARMESARVGLVDRVRAAVGSELRLHCAGGIVVAGTLNQVGADWALVDEAAGQQAVVPIAAVLAFGGLGWLSALPGDDGTVGSRLGLGSVLRGIGRERIGVRAYLLDSTMLAGTIDRVGTDFVELALHPVGQPRRRSDVRDRLVVRFAALAVVRRGPASG
jgi:hypothetical protein